MGNIKIELNTNNGNRAQYNLIKKEMRLSEENNTGNFDLHYGNRNLEFPSMNIDTLKKANAIGNLATHLHDREIDIARIQETHNDIAEMITRSGYGIYFSGQQDRPTTQNEHRTIRGGVAIAIKKEYI